MAKYRYTILLDREGDDDYPDAHEGSDEKAIVQVAQEIQEAMDETGLPAGWFEVVRRELVPSGEPFPDGKAYENMLATDYELDKRDDADAEKDLDAFLDEVEPRCDLCGEPEGEGEADWNGETGNHASCEEHALVGRINAGIEEDQT